MPVLFSSAAGTIVRTTIFKQSDDRRPEEPVFSVQIQGPPSRTRPPLEQAKNLLESRLLEAQKLLPDPKIKINRNPRLRLFTEDQFRHNTYYFGPGKEPGTERWRVQFHAVLPDKSTGVYLNIEVDQTGRILDPEPDFLVR